MEIDDVLKSLGGLGRFQKLLLAMLSLINLPVAFNVFVIVFTGAEPDHWCRVPHLTQFNLTLEQIKHVTVPKVVNWDGEEVYSQCTMYTHNYTWWGLQEVEQALNTTNRTLWQRTSCQHGWSYDDSQYESTIVTQWDLVCGSQWLQAVSTSTFMAGSMIGSLALGTASDMIGRRPTLCASLVMMTVLCASVAFSPNYIAFVILRFLLALLSIPCCAVAFVLIVEIEPPAWRMHTSISLMYAWAFSSTLIPLVAYGIRHWFTLQLATTLPNALLLWLICVLPESPRWLYAKNKRKAGEKVIRRIATCNGIKMPDHLDIEVAVQPKAFLWDLFRTPRLRLRTLNICFNWFVNSVVYYGLSLNTSNLAGNAYINFFISAAVEIPAYLFCQVLMAVLGRRWPLIATMTAGGAALLCSIAVPPDLHWLSVFLAMTGKFAISASFAIVYIFTAELYPTVVRNVGLGAGSFCARVGGIVAPFIAQLSKYDESVPLVVFGACALLAGLLALFLPETKDHKLPESLEDGENFGRGHERTSFVCCRPEGHQDETESDKAEKERMMELATTSKPTQFPDS